MVSAPAPEATEDSVSSGAQSDAATESGERFPTHQVRQVVWLWRRSLRFRVVTSTLLLGLVVVSIISLTMYRSIADGLVADRIERAQADAREETARAQADFNNFTPPQDSTDATGSQTLSDHYDEVADRLEAPAGDDSRYKVLTVSRNNSEDSTLGSELSAGIELDDIPTTLRDALVADPEHQQTTTIELEKADSTNPNAPFWRDSGPTTVPAVVVGSQIEVQSEGSYDLYFIYPMEQEQATLDIISRSFILGSLFLIGLVSAIAYIVTSTVVTPVRRAAAAAERLSSGHLNERMSARGHDDLAMLGQSFNEMADNLQTQIRQLEGLSRVQQRFVSDVSHELRTPLTTIRMAADLLHSSRDEMDPVAGRSAELLHNELDRFEELLADLLEISRYDAGVAVLDQDPTDLYAIIDRVIEASRSIAHARGSEIIVHRESGDSAVAEVDARRIERVLRNLVVNAIEHGEGHPVEIWVGSNDDGAAVLVRDHGVGLKAGEASLVFNRFWRADPARTRTTGGSGLGLAIALEDARLHHGWLQAWGEEGKGSRFRLTVPRTAGGPLTTSPLPLTPREGELPSEEA